MLKPSHLLAPLAALVLVFAFSALLAAAEPAGKGTVTGTVLDKDGKAIADIEVRLMVPARSAGNQPAAGGRVQPVASATTDADGKFTMKDVPAGDYAVVARSKEKGIARARVTVVADQSATVSLTLGAPGERAGRRNK